MDKSISIFGSGGHAKVVLELASLNGIIVESIYDDDLKKDKTFINGIQVNSPSNLSFSGYSVVSIGDNKARKMIANSILYAKWVTLVHPTAIISKDVIIGEGTVIMAGAIIQSGTKIGKHCIINTGSCIDHDSVISDYVHVAPNSSLAGGVSIGEGAFIGIGTCVIPNISIGKWTIIGAGSAVINDQPDYCTSVGVPANPIKFNNEKE